MLMTGSFLGRKNKYKNLPQNTTIILSEDPTQPGILFGLLIPYEQRKDKWIVGTTIYNQELGAKNWQESHE